MALLYEFCYYFPFEGSKEEDFRLPYLSHQQLPAGILPMVPEVLMTKVGGAEKQGPVSAAPWGSAAILPISYAYTAMMGPEGLTEATRYAILNANYIAKRLEPYFPVLYKGANDRVAHECIIDMRTLKHDTGVEVDDVAKRLMDYGFHAPTMHWPVMNTLMIEPTESESLEELDRFCEALIAIHGEIQAVKNGELDPGSNPLRGAPHTAAVISGDDWDRAYSREQAAFPRPVGTRVEVLAFCVADR